MLKASLLLNLMCVITFYSCTTNLSPLSGKIICIDPGHGSTTVTDTFRLGVGGEREEWINLRVALHLKNMLKTAGAKVIMIRSKDISVGLKERASLAIENKADVFVSIHHNATADTSVNFPIVYFHGNSSENQAGVQLGKIVIRYFKKELYKKYSPVSLVSDYVIFPGCGTAVLRHSYGIPGIIGEASFFTNPKQKQKLKDNNYNKKEAVAYFKALKDFFSREQKPIIEKNTTVKISRFPVLKEAERMSDIVKQWKQDFIQAKELFKNGSREALLKALKLFTRSAQSFPDSWLAAKAHYYRSLILEKFGESEKAEMERKRIKEHYVLQD